MFYSHISFASKQMLYNYFVYMNVDFHIQLEINGSCNYNIKQGKIEKNGPMTLYACNSLEMFY